MFHESIKERDVIAREDTGNDVQWRNALGEFVRTKPDEIADVEYGREEEVGRDTGDVTSFKIESSVRRILGERDRSWWWGTWGGFRRRIEGLESRLRRRRIDRDREGGLVESGESTFDTKNGDEGGEVFTNKRYMVAIATNNFL